MNLHVPSAETIRGYESLTTAGILLLILAVFGAVVLLFLVWLGRNLTAWVKTFAMSHLSEMTKQSLTLVEIAEKQNRLQSMQESWHRRLDAVLGCWIPTCPLKRTGPANPADYDPIPTPNGGKKQPGT